MRAAAVTEPAIGGHLTDQDGKAARDPGRGRRPKTGPPVGASREHGEAANRTITVGKRQGLIPVGEIGLTARTR